MLNDVHVVLKNVKSKNLLDLDQLNPACIVSILNHCKNASGIFHFACTVHGHIFFTFKISDYLGGLNLETGLKPGFFRHAFKCVRCSSSK